MAKIEAILEKLFQLSREGKIAWKPTVNPTTFSAVLGDSSALISKDGTTINLKLLDSSGDDLDHLSLWGDSRMEQLYESARRRALNIDARLDNVLGELSQL